MVPLDAPLATLKVVKSGEGHCCDPLEQYQTTTMRTADTFTKVYMYFKYISSQMQQLP